MESFMQDLLVQVQQIDFMALLHILRPAIICFTATKVLNNYELHKDYHPKNIAKVVLPPELKREYTELDIEKIASQKYGEALLKFTNVITKNFNPEDLTNFYNNIQTLKTKTSNFYFRNSIFGGNVVGTYAPKKNEICFEEGKIDTTIYHELFHMSSSKVTGTTRYSGFNQVSFPLFNSIGIGLDEGYTELLAERYFGYDSKVAFNYSYLMYIVEHVEQIIGRETMESLYLNSNLRGLIEELCKYMSEEDVMGFITSTDFIFKHINDSLNKPFGKNMLLKSFKNVNKFLIQCACRKLKYNIINNNKEEGISHLEQFSKFITSLELRINIKGQKQDIITVEELNRCINETLGNNSFNFEFYREEKEAKTK